MSDVIYVAPQPDWSFPLHNHEREAELSYVMAGAGTFFHDNRTRIVREGMLVVKNAGLSHAERSDPDNPLEQLCVSVRGVHYEGLPEGHVIPDDADPLLELGEDRELVAACFSFLRDHASDVDYEPLCAAAMGLVLDYLGYSWTHAHYGEMHHQWCAITMDGKKGYADGQVGSCAYGAHWLE